MNKKDILNKIKSLDGLTPDERAYLVNLVNTKKKYGLVWEDKPEDVEEELRTKIPVLKEVKDRAIINDTETEKHPNHILIEGDNLHALTALTFTHEEKIDLIYIDLPYNRGDNDFIYNDNYIDKEDSYRHSKWLSFMSKRLEKAKNLLKDDGYIFISIDKNEVAQLKLLMDELFLEKNYIELFSWVKTETPSNLSNKSKEKVEYVLCYQKKENNVRFKGLQKSSSSDNPMMKKQNSIKELTFQPGELFIKIKSKKINAGKYGTSKYDVELLNDLFIENNTNTNIVTLKARFIWTQENLENEIRNGTVMTIKTKSMVLSYEKTKYNPEVPPNLIDSSYGVGTNENAETELINLDLQGFEYPKPTSLIEYILGFNGKKDFIVFDFFAGSGTTGNAVININNNKNYRITSILATNNQNLIADNFCYPRLERTINGYEANNGYITKENKNNNLRYYQTAFVDREPTLANKRKLTQLATELLSIKEDCYIEVTGKLNQASWNKFFTDGEGQYVY